MQQLAHLPADPPEARCRPRTPDGLAAAMAEQAAQRKRKRGSGEHASDKPGNWTSDDSEAAEERAEHHYMLRVGDEFDKGRYSVVGQLGKGTFGRVVEMFDTQEKSAVAVKVVRAVEK